MLAFENKNQEPHSDPRFEPRCLRLWSISESSNWKFQLKRQRLGVRALAFELKLKYLKILGLMGSSWSPQLKQQHLDVRVLAQIPRCLLKTATAYMRHLPNNSAEALVFEDSKQRQIVPQDQVAKQYLPHYHLAQPHFGGVLVLKDKSIPGELMLLQPKIH